MASTAKSLGAPPPGLPEAIQTLVEITELAAKECRECRRIHDHEVVYDARAEHRANCCGQRAHATLIRLLGRTPFRAE
jgi:hypothetical protein